MGVGQHPRPKKYRCSLSATTATQAGTLGCTEHVDMATLSSTQLMVKQDGQVVSIILYWLVSFIRLTITKCLL